ncbi:hypothetical protein KUA24_44 [Vibrio phage HNL01]|nr:hypothetical protein KUA24_44 [Vibrio phage HNL01]
MKVKIKIDGKKYRNRFRIILDGVEYFFMVYWNDSLRLRGFSNSGWYVDIYDAALYDKQLEDNTAALILGGQKMMPDGNVLKGFRDERLPQGNLVCLDTALGADRYVDQEVSLYNFGTDKRFQLFYFSEGELEAILNEVG